MLGSGAVARETIKGIFSPDLNELETEIRAGDSTRLLFLLKYFSDSSIPHVAMQRDPDFFMRFANLVVLAGENTPLPYQIVENLLCRFADNQILSEAHLKEDVIIHCNKGKDVKCNRTVLGLSGEYFRQKIQAANISQGLHPELAITELTISRSALAMEAWKKYTINKSVEADSLGLRLMTQLYAIALQNQSLALAGYAKEKVLLKMEQRLGKEDTLLRYIKRIAKDELPAKQQLELELQAIMTHLRVKGISSILSVDKQHICLDVKDLSLLDEESKLSSLLQKRVNGFVLRKSEDISGAALYAAGAKKRQLKKMKEIIVHTRVEADAFLHLSTLFSNVESIGLSMDLMAEKRLEWYQEMKSFLEHDGLLKGFKWYQHESLNEYTKNCAVFSTLKQIKLIAEGDNRVGFFNFQYTHVSCTPLLIDSGSFYLDVDSYEFNNAAFVAFLTQLKCPAFEKVGRYKEKYLVDSHVFYQAYTQKTQE